MSQLPIVFRQLPGFIVSEDGFFEIENHLPHANIRPNYNNWAKIGLLGPIIGLSG